MKNLHSGEMQTKIIINPLKMRQNKKENSPQLHNSEMIIKKYFSSDAENCCVFKLMQKCRSRIAAVKIHKKIS